MQLHLSEIILGQVQIVSLPNFNCILSKFTGISWNYSKTIPNSDLAKITFRLLNYSKLLPLESKQFRLTLASVVASADSVDEHRPWSKNES